MLRDANGRRMKRPKRRHWSKSRNDHTLFSGHVSGSLLQTHLQSFLLQMSPFPQGVGGLSPNLHLHWQRSGFHSSKVGSHWLGLKVHSHPQLVWFCILISIDRFVPSTCTLTGTSVNCVGTHDRTEGWIILQDPPHLCNLMKYGKSL